MFEIPTFKPNLQTIYNNTNLPNLFTYNNYRKLRNIIFDIFRYKNKILKQIH